ncbi:MAG TPA: heme lyase CcmF/NrfE family subunit [Longimicrobiales bacterium]|nr:heme lyase CcmF/NrfE family subunit [Longimicrobiales bacterium]
MNIIGELALWVSLPVAIWGASLAFIGGRQNRGDLVLSAERTVYAALALITLASLGIVDTFLNDRFEYTYVASYSSLDLPTFYKVSGLWAGQTGSLLFWLLLMCGFSALAVWSNRTKNREFMPYVVGTLMVLQIFFLVVLLFADVNPYARLGFTPIDGQGLNPQLQNYWMTIHPPTLYLGFTAFTIPFAFAMAALLSGRLDSRWIVVTRKWILLSWFFLSNGIVFGMRWAYEELGWGGYWFWDPVENASLLPWLTATAFLHSVQIQETRGMLKVWNMGLVLATFLLTIFATFLTRSGLIESVHTFAENTKIAFIFLGFMGSIMALVTVLIIYRLPQLKSANQIESFISRESAFLFNNLILIATAFAVMWGTLLPLLSEGFMGQEISVGPAFFNKVNVPFGIAILFLMGVGPVIAWRRASKKNLQRNFLVPTAVGLATAAGLWLAGARVGLSVMTFGIGAFVLWVIGTEFWKGTKARARIEGEGLLRAFWHLVMRNRRRWGGYIVHVAIVVMFTAFATAPWYQEIRQTLDPGESAQITSPLGSTYTMTYEGLSTNFNDREDNLAWQAVALVTVEKDGKPLPPMTTEKREYIRPDRSTSTEVAIRSTAVEDLYITLADVNTRAVQMRINDPTAQTATFTFMVKPLVSWIWASAFVLTIGALIGMWPGGAPTPAPASRPATGTAEPAPTGD